MHENFEALGEVAQASPFVPSEARRLDDKGQAGEATLGSESFVEPQ